MRLKPVLIALATVFVVNISQADGIPIEPGQWEMTSTMTMSMMPQPKTTTTKECIEEDTLDPAAFNIDDENPCNISEVKIDSNTASWSINCPTDGGQTMEGSWEVTSHGDTLSGKGQMSTEFSGQKFGFDMAWKGKRIGDCE